MAIQDHPFLEIHPDLAKKKSIKDGNMVKIINETGYMTLPAKITKMVPADTVVMYEGWWKGVNYTENFTVKALQEDMGEYQKGSVESLFTITL